MIAEDYVSYEVAKLLKESGFDWMCNGYYNKDDDDSEPYFGDGEGADNWNNQAPSVRDLWFSAPTHQMAMKWLRKNNIIVTPQPEYFSCDKCETWGIDIWADDNYEKLSGDFPTYEQAVDAALKYCLTELI